MKLKSFRHTIISGYISFITQAIVNNFTPLLFITFQRDWGITLSQLAFISTYNFAVQLLVDIASAKFADKIGVKRCFIGAHILSASGFISLGILPFILENHFIGILISITLYAMGGGLIEVLASPIVEACPTTNKEANMSLLHSFYCWGQMLAVILSTVFFAIFGIHNWRYASFLWAIIPILNTFYIAAAPMVKFESSQHEKTKFSTIFKDKIFLMLIIMMLAAGASELAMSQWASAFAESSLGISKAMGDLAGPCFFALCMGISRVSHTALCKKISLESFITFCSILCFVAYLVASFAPLPIISLLACGVCGFSVGIMWPGTYSLAAKMTNKPSTAMFAFLALAGDFGCSTGPMLVGSVSEAFGNNLKSGLAAASIFPVIMIVAVLSLVRMMKKSKQ